MPLNHTEDHFQCLDCEAAFSVDTKILKSGYVRRIVIAHLIDFTGECPHCHSQNLIMDIGEGY